MRAASASDAPRLGGPGPDSGTDSPTSETPPGSPTPPCTRCVTRWPLFLVSRGQILHAQARLGHADAAIALREYAHALPLTDAPVADHEWAGGGRGGGSLRTAAGSVGHHGAMTTPSHLDRITVDAAICHGKPVIRGMRVPVQTVLELLAAGMTFEEILTDHDYLEREDLLAALEYGAATAGGQQVIIAGS